MSAVSVFSGAFCRENEIVEHLVGATGYQMLNDEKIVKRAAALSSIPEEMLKRAFSAKSSIFNPFSHDRERSITWLKLALAEYLQDAEFFLHGFVSHLVPGSIRHILRVCLIADMAFRVESASSQLCISDTEATELIKEEDSRRAFWVDQIRAVPDPWDPALYDLILPTNKIFVQDAVALIKKSLGTDALQASESSRRAAGDFLAAARIETHLASEGHFVQVTVKDDEVVLIIDRPVLMFERLEEELKTAVRAVKNARQIKVRTKTAEEKMDIYRRYDSKLPSKVLLVDDEREFVQTLSERLAMRNIGSSATFNGESALAMVDEEEPEVMLLDLKMPGIDGMEVLKKVKTEHPQIEVVILTGHGTEVDREECIQLGAFAYLEKPVDIDILSDILKKANEKIRDNANKK
ncbi:MAG: response regulator [Deltaproteobacteria bacterium]|nr:response regulator [Deltaproteobacteria bacterium]